MHDSDSCVVLQRSISVLVRNINHSWKLTEKFPRYEIFYFETSFSPLINYAITFASKFHIACILPENLFEKRNIIL